MWFLLLLACGSCSDAEKPTKKKSKAPKSALVDWPAVPASIVASDKAALDNALTRVAPSAANATGAKGDDIAVIVLDTTRADRLGVYGYTEKTSPNLDAWAKGAHVWDRAYSDAPWTLPSHASMFTGKCQREHGARSMDSSDPRKGAPLPQTEVTIAETLQSAGYRTVGITGNRAFLHPAYGLSQGFDVWINEQMAEDPRGVPYSAADRLVPLALSVAKQDSSQPVFLFINLMDAHSPYKPRENFVADPSVLHRKSLPGNGGGFRKQASRLMQGSLVEPKVIASWSMAYDSGLRWMDTQLGPLLAGLDGFEHVFILSDHGEFLGEHKLVEHGKDLYQPVTHIPFMVKSAKYPPGRDSTLVQTHDLAWMVLEAAGQPVPTSVHRTDGIAVSDLYYTFKKDLNNPDYGHRFNRIRRSFWVGDHKLIVDDKGGREGYDLSVDPTEQSPKFNSPEFATLAEQYLVDHPEIPVLPVGSSAAEPTEELLRKLGYIE